MLRFIETCTYILTGMIMASYMGAETHEALRTLANNIGSVLGDLIIDGYNLIVEAVFGSDEATQ